MKKISISIVLAIVILISYYCFISNARSGHYISPERRVDQLTTDYYLGPTIDETNHKIFDIQYYERLDSMQETALPIGYYIIFQYQEDDDISCEVIISSKPLEGYTGDIIKSDFVVYEGHEIYRYEFYDEDRNLVTLSKMAIIGEHVCSVEVPIIDPEDVNFERYEEISLEFMLELIDNFMANKN